jgi:outer membrane protein TolC
MHRPAFLVTVALFSFSLPTRAGEGGNDLGVLHRPLSKVEALNIAIAHNGTIRQAQKDVEAAAGVAIQTRAIVFPKVSNNAEYVAREDSLIEQNEDRNVGPIILDLPPPIGPVQSQVFQLPKINNQSWFSDFGVTQSIYEGGRMLSAVRSARLINEQALLAFQSIVADTLLSVSNAYDDVIRAAMQIQVRTDSVTFLRGYLGQTTDKFNAGSLPEFDVMRQTAEVGNAEADQVRAIGDHRVAKQRLVELLGYDLSPAVSDDLPLNLTTPLVARAYGKSLSASLIEARENRTEILALEKEERLRDEAIIDAKAGYKPSVQAFAGYQLTSRVQSRTAADELHGGLIGARLSWAVFDGFLTKGRVDEAVALRGRASEAKAETTRQVELQVRTAWSDLRTARAVLDAQSGNVNTAKRSLELSQIRYNEGAGTQIDVLDAQSALTQSHGDYVDALRDYSVARAALIRATGANLQWSYAK